MRTLSLISAGLVASVQQCWSIEFQHEILPSVPSSGYTNYSILGENGQLAGTTNFGTGNRTFILTGSEFRFFTYPGSSVTFPTAVRDSNFFIGKYGPSTDGFVYDNGVYGELRTIENNELITPSDMSLNGNICGNISRRPGLFARIGGADYSPAFVPGFMYGEIYGINNNGLSLVFMEDGHSESGCFYWSPALGMNALPWYQCLVDLNNRDEMVGFQEDLNGLKAIRIKDGITSYLGSGTARLTNDNSWVLIHDNHEGYLWRNGVRTNMRDLIDPSLKFDGIGFADMNNRGQILAGVYDIVNGLTANPRSVLFTPVPEPASFFVVAGGLALLTLRRKQKRVLQLSHFAQGNPRLGAKSDSTS